MNKNDVISLKLATGEEVIGRYESENNAYISLKKPLAFIMGAQGIGLGPFMISADKDATIEINKSSMVSIVQAEASIAKQYLKQTTGLML
jgi:hypothetical protein